MGGGTGGDSPTLSIVGTSVALGPARRELVPLLQRWGNDFAMQRTLGGLPCPLTFEAERARYARVTSAPDEVVFALYEREGWRPIGITELQGIDQRQRTAEFVIFIGEPSARGKGYGTETTRLMLDYAFTTLGLHSVMLRAYAYNLAGLRAYQKAGFKEIGRRRQCHWMGGRFWDVIYMDCLASEWGGGRWAVGGEVRSTEANSRQPTPHPPQQGDGKEPGELRSARSSGGICPRADVRPGW